MPVPANLRDPRPRRKVPPRASRLGDDSGEGSASRKRALQALTLCLLARGPDTKTARVVTLIQASTALFKCGWRSHRVCAEAAGGMCDLAANGHRSPQPSQPSRDNPGDGVRSGAALATRSPQTHSNGDGHIEAAAHRDVYGFKLEGKVDWRTYSAWQYKYERSTAKRRAKWQKLIAKHPGLGYLQSKQLKAMVRNGLVDGVRGKVWMESSGAAQKMQENPELYAQLVEESADTSTLEAYGQIELDLPRTFPDHLDFRANLHAAPGEDAIASSAQLLKLRRVLRAYARRNSSVGYCQGLNFIVGLMLLVLDEHQVFWLLVVLLEEVLPADYYARDLFGCSVDLRVFQEVLASRQPKLWNHMRAAGLGAEVFCLEWFIALFAKTMPTETVLRVWDALFLEGYKILFRIGLAVMQLYEKSLLRISEPHELFCAVQGLGKREVDHAHTHAHIQRAGGWGER